MTIAKYIMLGAQYVLEQEIKISDCVRKSVLREEITFTVLFTVFLLLLPDMLEVMKSTIFH